MTTTVGLLEPSLGLLRLCERVVGLAQSGGGNVERRRGKQSREQRADPPRMKCSSVCASIIVQFYPPTTMICILTRQERQPRRRRLLQNRSQVLRCTPLVTFLLLRSKIKLKYHRPNARARPPQTAGTSRRSNQLQVGQPVPSRLTSNSRQF